MADPLWNDVTLLMHLDQTVNTSTTTDVSSFARPVTIYAGGPLITTAQFKFGGASAGFGAAPTAFRIAGGQGGSIGSLDFTMESWVRFSTGTASLATAWDMGNPPGYFHGLHLTAGGLYGATAGGSGWNISPQAGLNLADNAWHHVAAVRSGSTLYLWVDGVNRAQYNIGSAAFVDDTSGQILIGTTNSSPVTLYEDEVRFTRGVARYTAPFTPPTEPFPEGGNVNTNVSNTKLEAVSRDTSFVTPGVANSPIVSQQIAFLLDSQILVSNSHLEAIGKDSGFVSPNVGNSTAVSQQIAALIPSSRLVSDYSTEVISLGQIVRPVSDMAFEVISGLPYSTIGSRYAVEAVALSTITPPGASQQSFWFITA